MSFRWSIIKGWVIMSPKETGIEKVAATNSNQKKYFIYADRDTHT